MHAFEPDWPTPPGVAARMGTREVDTRAQPDRWVQTLGVPTQWLNQVHGTAVALLQHPVSPETIIADASVTLEPGLACTVRVADCLPVLFTTADGRAVAAAHAGWRGLSGGILQATVDLLCRQAQADPTELLAWLGPCIGPQAFEVGGEVLQAFGADPHDMQTPLEDLEAAADHPWRWRPRPDGSPRWLADLPALARTCLREAGVTRLYGGRECTYRDASRFFSFRRDGASGRMAASIWRCS